MALARDRNINDIQARISYYGGGRGPSVQGLDHASSLELSCHKGAAGMSMLDDGDGAGDSLGSYSGSLLPMLPDPSNSTSSSYVFGATDSPPDEAQTVGPWTAGGGSSSLLSFDRAGFVSLHHEDESALWIDTMDQNYYLDDHHTKHGASDQNSSRPIHQDQSCFEMVTSGGYGLSGEKRCGDDRFGLLYPVATAVDRSVVQENMGQAKGPGQKRPIACTDGDMPLPSPKKQCAANRKSKDKCSPSKDPQSLAAKNRRERISERLKVLQDLVPNGTKVDLVTMLEKAITYVKFLQLQVKVLATDEFWPAQGRKAPELSQVKEAVDAILYPLKEKGRQA